IFYPCETSQISKTSKTFDTFSYFLTGQYFFTVGGLWSAYDDAEEKGLLLNVCFAAAPSLFRSHFS
ncbi:hypothetical protein, partial [Faecalibacterium sp. An77]|uniref:hypothetical protein n=1 Tax=Faecalibacterium sp. An77 TaxID=1965655 RepID=UPI0019505BEB